MNIRDVLNPDLGVRGMSSEWWREQMRVAIIMNKGILMAALRNVPRPYDCPRIGLGHGQCVEVQDEKNPIRAIVRAMHKRLAILNGCSLYVESWPSSKWTKLCAIGGIKTIYYASGSPTDDELDLMEKYGVEVNRVSV